MQKYFSIASIRYLCKVNILRTLHNEMIFIVGTNIFTSFIHCFVFEISRFLGIVGIYLNIIISAFMTHPESDVKK